jgi:hypothetical protein
VARRQYDHLGGNPHVPTESDNDTDEENCWFC